MATTKAIAQKQEECRLKIAVHVLAKINIVHMMGASRRDMHMFVFPEYIERTGPIIVSQTLEDNAPFVAIEWR